MAAPVTFSSGKGPMPKINIGSRIIFTNSPAVVARKAARLLPMAVKIPVNAGYALGSERKKEASLYAANALQLSVILGLIYGLICSGFNSPLIGFFKLNSPHVISDARMYLVITCGFVIFSFLNQTFT